MLKQRNLVNIAGRNSRQLISFTDTSFMFTKLQRKIIVAHIVENITNRQSRYSRTLICTTVHLWSMRVKFAESALRQLLVEEFTC